MRSRKLTRAQTTAVVKAYRKGSTTYAKLAKKYKCSRSVIERTVKAAGSNAKRKRAIQRRSVKRAEAMAIERESGRIVKVNEKLLTAGEELLIVQRAEIRAEAERIKNGEGDPIKFRALIGGYKDLVVAWRLQTGQSTTNAAVSGQIQTHAIIESPGQAMRRRLADRGVKSFRVIDARLPGSEDPDFEAAKKAAAKRQRRKGKR